MRRPQSIHLSLVRSVAFKRRLQGCLAHKKAPQPKTLQYGCTSGPVVVLEGRGALSYERGTPVPRVGCLETEG